MATRPKLDFREIKSRVTIEQVARMLNLTLKRETDGFRCNCTFGGNARAIKITPNHQNEDGTLGAFYCWDCKDGGDCIKLYAHVKSIRQYDAATAIAEHFGIGTTPHRAPSPSKKPEPEGPREGLKRLDYLVHEHEVIEMLGLSRAACEAIGIGFANKGTMSGRIAIPLLLPDGTLAGYLGVATKADQKPLLKFPANLDEMCNLHTPSEEEKEPEMPEESSPDELRKLFRVVGE